MFENICKSGETEIYFDGRFVNSEATKYLINILDDIFKYTGNCNNGPI